VAELPPLIAMFYCFMLCISAILIMLILIY